MKRNNIDLNNLEEKENQTLEDVYINENKNDYIKNFDYRPFSAIGGLRPFSREEIQLTAQRKFNSHIDDIFKDKQSKDNFYQTVQDFQKNEVEFLKKNNKQDHVKKIFSTLNYKTKETSYKAAHEFDENKQKETLEHDFKNHYKKSFMKTYEEIKLKHKIVIRK